jgi:uncharacterized protein (TIGR02996 family)
VEELKLLYQNVLNQPDDDSHRLILADWMEEHDDHERICQCGLVVGTRKGEFLLGRNPDREESYSPVYHLHCPQCGVRSVFLGRKSCTYAAIIRTQCLLAEMVAEKIKSGAQIDDGKTKSMIDHLVQENCKLCVSLNPNWKYSKQGLSLLGKDQFIVSQTNGDVTFIRRGFCESICVHFSKFMMHPRECFNGNPIQSVYFFDRAPLKISFGEPRFLWISMSETDHGPDGINFLMRRFAIADRVTDDRPFIYPTGAVLDDQIFIHLNQPASGFLSYHDAINALSEAAVKYEKSVRTVSVADQYKKVVSGHGMAR